MDLKGSALSQLTAMPLTLMKQKKRLWSQKRGVSRDHLVKQPGHYARGCASDRRKPNTSESAVIVIKSVVLLIAFTSCYLSGLMLDAPVSFIVDTKK